MKNGAQSQSGIEFYKVIAKKIRFLLRRFINPTQVKPTPEKPLSDDEKAELGKILNASISTIEGLEYFNENGQMRPEEWPDKGDATKWGVDLSTAKGVTLILAPESHKDMSTSSELVKLLKKECEVGKNKKNKMTLFLEAANEELTNMTTKEDNVLSNLIIETWQNKNIEPSTPRASNHNSSPTARKTKKDLHNMLHSKEIGRRFPNANMSDIPNVDIVGFEDLEAKLDFLKIKNPYSDSQEELILGIQNRNQHAAKNIVKYCQKTGLNFCGIKIGAAHEYESHKLLISKDIMRNMKEAGINCNIVHLRTSRVKYPKIDKNVEFEHILDYSMPDTLVRIGFARGQKKTMEEILYIGKDPEASTEDKSYNLIMRVIARQELAKKPEDRRVGASNKKTIDAAQYEENYIENAYQKLCAQCKYLKKIEKGNETIVELGGKRINLSNHIKKLEKNMQLFSQEYGKTNRKTIYSEQKEIAQSEIKTAKDYAKANACLSLPASANKLKYIERETLKENINKYDEKIIAAMARDDQLQADHTTQNSQSKQNIIGKNTAKYHAKSEEMRAEGAGISIRNM